MCTLPTPWLPLLKLWAWPFLSILPNPAIWQRKAAGADSAGLL